MTGQLPPGWTITPPPNVSRETPNAVSQAQALPPGWTVTPPTPQQEFRNGPVGFADNVIRRLGDKAAFGFGDEIAAGLDADIEVVHPITLLARALSPRSTRRS